MEYNLSDLEKMKYINKDRIIISKYFNTVEKTNKLKFSHPFKNINTYMILMTGRCGSTWLAELIAQLKCCGNPREYFLETRLKNRCKMNNKKLYLSEYIRYHVKNNTINNYFGFQIDPMRLSWYQYYPEMEFTNLSLYLRKYIWMTRTDILSQAYSYAYSKKSGIWHNIKSITLSENISIDDRLIWNELLSIIYSEYWAEQIFRKYSISPLRITYEELVTNKSQVLGRILNYLNIDYTLVEKVRKENNIAIKPISYNHKDQRLLTFYKNYQEIIHAVYDMRINIRPLREYFAIMDSSNVPYDKNHVRWYPVNQNYKG